MSRQTQVPNSTIELSSTESNRQSRSRVWEHRLVWLLLLAVAGLWGYNYLISRVDNKLTREILNRLQKEFPRHLVSIDRAHLQAGQSITIEGIRIAKSTDQGPRDILRCGRLVCSGPIEMIGLVQGQLPVQHVIADGMEICAWPLTDGRFCIQELASSKPLRPDLPNIEVRSGLIRIGNETGRAEKEIICHDLRARIGLAPRLVDGKVMPLAVKIEASVSSSFFRQTSLNATMSEDKKSWIAEGRVDKLEYSPRLADQLPQMLQQYLIHASGFSGELNSVFIARSDLGNVTFEAKANIAKGRLMHPKVPYPLESLSGEIYCKNGLLQFKNVLATSGEATFSCACNLMGFTIGSPMAATIQVTNLSLDQRLFDAIPASIQDTWRKLKVSGIVDAKASVRFDGKTWIPNVVVRAKDAGIEPEFFPYPVRNLKGDFVYERGSIVASKLTAIAGNQQINGSLSLHQAQPRWLMDLQLAADGPIEIDKALLKALSPREAETSGVHNFVHSLHPTGTVLLKRGRFVRSAENPEEISKAVELVFSECTIKYDGFRYPIVDVHGEVTMDNQRLILKNFVGRNDGARIKGRGVCQCRNSNLDSMELYFDGYDVRLDEELQQALPRSVRGLWDQLQPSGVLDQVAVEISRKQSGEPLNMRVEISEEREFESHAGRAVSIRPVSLPYQVNDVACSIIYRPGQVEIRSFKGSHELSQLQTEGYCRLHPDGTWNGVLTWGPTTRLVVEQSLLDCLPDYLREPLLRLDFHGPVSITGKTSVSSPPTPTESILRDWDVELQLEDGRLGGGGIASGIRGSISISGENTGHGPMAFGNLLLDALAIKNVAVTQVRGPFAFSKQELLFGRDAVAWQLKQSLRNPGSFSTQSDSPVANATYFSPQNVTSSPNIAQASFRSSVQDSLVNRSPLHRNLPSLPSDPNAVRSDQDVPSLDIKDNDIIAHTLSGTIFVSGVEPLEGQQRGKYRLRLVDADLQGCLVDLGETNSQAAGRLSIQCDLQGALTNMTALEGQGRGWLRHAKLYELPNMIRLLRALSITPGQGAFDSADVVFAIDGDRIPIQELNLDGDIVSMRGSGWINMRREVYLDLFAHVGRRSFVGKVFRPLARSEAATLWQIEVNGNISDPQIRPLRPMPLMNSIDKVIPEIENDSPR